MKRSNILDLFMTYKHEIDVHYGLQVFRPLHNFINLFINHHSGSKPCHLLHVFNRAHNLLSIQISFTK
jgi:hypothetical protein